MHQIAKYVIGLAVISLITAIFGYLLVLPELGRSTSAVAVKGLNGDAKRGEYLASAAGCLTCHTDFKKKGKLLAGGAAIRTAFGTFYGPNITHDKVYGIGFLDRRATFKCSNGWHCAKRRLSGQHHG